VNAQDRPLGFAALGAWLLTASLGGYMLRIWVTRGGLRRQRETGAGAPPLVIFGHMSLALTGLTLWCVFLAARWGPLAWVCVGVIAATIVFGICMVTLWTPYPVRPDPATPGDPPPAEAPSGADPFAVTDEMIARLLAGPFPARRRPCMHLLPLIPVCHGFLALGTFMLSMLTAIGTQ
jgi:manganese efflux pump family protein